MPVGDSGRKGGRALMGKKGSWITLERQHDPRKGGGGLCSYVLFVLKYNHAVRLLSVLCQLSTDVGLTGGAFVVLGYLF